MRCRLATILFMPWVMVASAIPGPLSAGPWARGAGEGFLSLSGEIHANPNALMLGIYDSDSYVSLYGEVGLGGSYTLGGEWGRGDDAHNAEIFLRYTLTDPSATWQFALDGGVGMRRDDGPFETTRPLLRLGASVGRGFGGIEARRWWMPIAHEGGWVTLDVKGLYDTDRDDLIWKGEITLGLVATERLRLILQVMAEDWPGLEPSTDLSPSVVWSFTERTSLQAGARMRLDGDTRAGVQLGLWHSF